MFTAVFLQVIGVYTHSRVYSRSLYRIKFTTVRRLVVLLILRNKRTDQSILKPIFIINLYVVQNEPETTPLNLRAVNLYKSTIVNCVNYHSY
jgi:hypothetical protein